MSPDGGRLGVGTRLRSGGRVIAVGALAGLALGFAWGIADEPRYTATATVIVEARGEADPAELERLAALGASAEVATLAAGILGGDVAGADLLADVSVQPGLEGGTVVVSATSELPDFAAAAADGFAAALVETTADDLKQRLRGKLAELDPSSGEVAAIEERISDLDGRRPDAPVSAGAAAELPGEPSENRSAAAWSLGGLAAGLLLGALVALLRGRRQPGPASEPPERVRAIEPAPEVESEPAAALAPEAEAEPAAEPVEAAFEVPLLARFADPEAAVIAVGPGLIRLAAGEVDAFRGIASAIGLADQDAPRTLATIGASEDDGAAAVAAGIAAVAAELGLHVLAVDADLTSPTLAGLLGVDGAPGLRDYLDGRATPREVLRTARAEVDGDEPSTLVAVPAGEPSGGGASSIVGARFEALVERLPRVYDLVVFAGPPQLAEEDAAALAGAVDAIVIVSSGEGAARERIERSVRMLAGEPVVGGVLTRT